MAAPNTMPTITLDAREEQLKTLLVSAALAIDAEDLSGSSPAPPPREPLVLRWAGGWVRDKLLGTPSHDIDTAINVMTGEAFVDRLRGYCSVPAHRARHGLKEDDVGRLHTVPRNPDKSKHLETSTIKLCGLDVDFVNLRREQYTEESRNPAVEFGTAEEDALRRDATVNALFYNLGTGEVEDFVGGLGDLEGGLIRTPLEPLQTFLDDPLRVLRLVRFASRLGFRIDEVAEGVMADERVLGNLKVKISRERIGIELEKMMSGKRPVESLRLLHRLGLYHAVFTNPERADMPQPSLSSWSGAYECLEHLEQTKTPGSIYNLLVTSDEARSFAWSLAALTPWEPLPDDPPLRSGKAALPLASQAAREGLRAPNKLSDVVTAAHRHRPAIAALKDAVCAGAEEARARDRLGLAIRDWDARGGNWRLQVLFAVLVDVEEKVGAAGVTKAGAGGRGAVLAEWQRFLDHLVEMDVMNAPNMKRLVDGKLLMKELGAKPGRWTGPALEVALAWQLRNPGVEDPSGAVEENSKQTQGKLLSILACLRCEGHITRSPSPDDDLSAVKQFTQTIAALIAPILPQHQHDQSTPPDESLPLATTHLFTHCLTLSPLALATLSATTTHAPGIRLPNTVLYTLLAYTDPAQPYTTPSTSSLASDLVQAQLTLPSGPSKSDFLTRDVLQEYLRPLFSASKPAAVTAQGRRAEYVDDAAAKAGRMPEENVQVKPWKYGDLRAVGVVAWAVREVDSSLLTTTWPLFLPVLLTLTDDPSTPLRHRGLLLLTTFLTKLPTPTLHAAGLARLFEDAVFPTLAFLPSLTPAEESALLLPAAYGALLALAEKQPTGKDDDADQRRRNALLDRVLREGVFTGYFHARDHVAVVQVLCEQAAAVVRAMGVHAVKHLKDLVPMISSVLTDPFAPAAPGTLRAGIKTLHAVLASCWPRILPGGPWVGEIVNALVLCWVYVVEYAEEHPREGVYTPIEQELGISSRALAAVLRCAEGGPVDLEVLVAPLVEKDARLAGLFFSPCEGGAASMGPAAGQ
ncbi:mitochondrial CCA tRNA nucleotidyltransferase [Staphylotrichum tortipilum]|uniref:Mitochondrial CCA tRNA nucleotidyltransferase n=1 Tax=Staphylotrichum tortipilum TaxID=2831512 RepID=A0AAN6MPZ0_9PEZI|nr:mitochondrial CCA tRNA nucleotidyltransferase [Staphylotrichum longicolle]